MLDACCCLFVYLFSAVVSFERTQSFIFTQNFHFLRLFLNTNNAFLDIVTTPIFIVSATIDHLSDTFPKC